MAINTRVLAPEFQYLESTDLGQVLDWLDEYREKAKILAGGTDLLVQMKTASLQPDYVIYIKKIAELDYIKSDNEGLKIGAATALDVIERNETVKTYYSALYEAIHSMAARAIRNMGSIGGNLGNASPAADTAPPLLVYDATLKLVSRQGERVIPVVDYFLGPGETILKDNELIAEINIPKLNADNGSSFLKYGRVSADIAKINVAVNMRRDDKKCESCRIAFGSVAPTPIRIKEAEAVLEGKEINADLLNEAAQVGADGIKPITDIRSTKTYRQKVSKVMLAEALQAAWQRAGGVI